MIYYIPEMPCQVKPIYYDNNIRNTFIRYDGKNQRAKDKEIENFLREASESSGSISPFNLFQKKYQTGTKVSNKFIHPLLAEKLTKMTICDKPQSPNQQYVITEEGKELLQELKEKTNDQKSN